MPLHGGAQHPTTSNDLDTDSMYRKKPWCVYKRQDVNKIANPIIRTGAMSIVADIVVLKYQHDLHTDAAYGL
jgi:hypothetical protein